ncbi:hypothetical protein GCM10025867_41600 [Frondihabitans sucicola]|uniref:HTH gntR-type domain-containing protein n=1 Tax=Frondihabitans sucicola TaxID=1268041 RepID=A0ABM8GU76_9MICO|nr:GntR family transcriptional regulator [Frondihabitans sucicola]BDZ51919.1 hypothetical protein GCM10025867_41600 [Frondihabitans sucicola]
MPVPNSSPGSQAAIQPARRLLTDDVYDRLQDDIVRGRLAGGQRIHDIELAGQLGFSRATVRTALLRLTQLGLVETVPNLYTRVTSIDLVRYLQTQDTARALYLFAARYATPVLTDAHLAILTDWSTSLGSGRVDPEAIFTGKASNGFFQVFLDALDNGPLQRTIQRLRPHLLRVMGQYSELLPSGEIDATLLSTIEAASRRDPDATAEALTAYYEGPLETFHARLAAQPEFTAG